MKKLFCALFAAIIVAGAVFAVPTKHNETHEENWSSISYVNVPILKILDSREGYVIIYQKNKYGVGQTVIPKKWAKGSKEEPRKLRIRYLSGGKLKPFMTIVKDDGNFQNVILSIPAKKTDAIWGVVASGKTLEGIDKDVLEEIEL
ncbi:MAG: hypothetical protein SPE48_03770 [Treponema porcinum]|uniref:hypothetical protein n=1 Tax=Treponema porcinum TaxID=261392 RepID=UPI0023541709|nr:hypothetical protein [Treponema porcinum]MCI6482697.1 hypothetical protein [Treponema porcinum]MDY5121015.1 hypothetical protein [Treponema porcinum]